MIEWQWPRTFPFLNLSVMTLVSALVVMNAEGLAQTSAPARPAPPESAGPPETLLTRAPFDRIQLADMTEIEVEPVTPRPLPPVKKASIKRSPTRKQRSPETEARLTEAEKDPAIRIMIQPLEADGAEYAVYREDMTRVVYFEEMLLAEADKLTAAGDFAKAFEYLMLVQARDANWAGLAESHRRLLLAEARERFQQSDLSSGLQFVTEALAKNPGDNEAKALAVQGLEKLARQDIDAGRFERARESYARMKSIDSSAPDVKALAESLQSAAKELFDNAPADRPERLDVLNDAYRAWPETEGLAAARAEALKRWPTLRVGVAESISQPPKPWGVTLAGQRASDLTYLPLLKDLQEASFKGQTSGQLLERFEMTDLTTAQLQLKPDLKWSSGRAINARDVVAALSSWALPSSPAYRGVWASLVESVTATDDRKIQVKFVRPVLQPENWFLRPIGPAETSQAEKVTMAAWSGSGAYQWTGAKVESSGAESIFERSPGVSTGLFRIRELVFENEMDAWQALLDDRLDLLEHVPAEVASAPAGNDQIRLGNYSVPEVHLMALDGRAEQLANRSLRRALGYALDRAEILEEQFLRRPPTPDELVADGPFPKGSAWDDPETKAQPYDAAMATLLFASAKRELKSQRIKLTIDYPRRADITRSVARIADILKSYGLEITLRSWSPDELEARLASGQPFELAWRVISPGPDHFVMGGWVCPSLYAPPATRGLAALASPITLSQVLDVERAWNENAVRDAGRFVDRLCRQELPILPLWQVPRRFAVRKNLAGIPNAPDRLYKSIDQWQLSSPVPAQVKTP